VPGAHPSAFAPVKGAWGGHGATIVTLAGVDEDALGEALTLAWQNRATKRAAPARPRARTPARPASAKPAASPKRR
jgi:hypothetical protein